MSHLEGRIKEKAGPRARLFQLGVRRTQLHRTDVHAR